MRMRLGFHAPRAAVVLLCATLLATLSACGATAGSSRAQIASTSPTVAGTPTPTRPLPTPTPQGDVCVGAGASSGTPAATSGDFTYSKISTMGIDPQRQLPDDTPLKPYVVSQTFNDYLSHLPLVNESVYGIYLCNTSPKATHVIKAVSVRIERFTADTNPISTTHNCIHIYTRQGMEDHTGCGGGYAGGYPLNAIFNANATTGAVAKATTDDSSTPPSTTFQPITLIPGYGAGFITTVTPPSAPGSYTLTFGFTFDSSAAVYPSVTAPPVLFATVAHQWDGDACLSSAMQSQIPAATTPPTQYICPGA